MITGMEEAISEELLQVRFHSPLGEELAVYPLGIQLCNLVDLHAWGVLHGEDLTGCLIPVDAGHSDPGSAAEVLAESVCILPFQPVINLLYTGIPLSTTINNQLRRSLSSRVPGHCA